MEIILLTLVYLTLQVTVENTLQVNFTSTQTLCFPVKQGSFQRIAVNWGGSRRNGAGCHTGIDIFTKSPGHVVAITDGVVTSISNYILCKNGKTNHIIYTRMGMRRMST